MLDNQKIKKYSREQLELSHLSVNYHTMMDWNI